MNTYKKYAPNVFIAVCDEAYERGDTIIVTTKHGKENEHIVHNFLGYTGTKENPKYCYSITRADGYNAQEHAKKKAEKYESWAQGAKHKSNMFYEASKEGYEFLILGEPIKVGHHSEKRHRALIERNHKRMSKSMEELEKVEYHLSKAAYWKKKENVINLSMPESLEYYAYKLEEATKYHQGLKDGSIEREHSYSLTYAKKEVNNFKKLLEQAEKLWGNNG